ncbi:hypothetical protein [Aeromicrobium sp. CTD01-1L150]|uniref:hypothetical protein n=1 Tax=Aeromicrobium sp. CTD01-1L150 TaxID=3341830 RepID=UPI0035BF030A
MAPELFYARAVIMFVRARADEARRQGRNELGASAIEWAIISGVLVVLALLLGRIIQGVVESNASKIESGG